MVLDRKLSVCLLFSLLLMLSFLIVISESGVESDVIDGYFIGGSAPEINIDAIKDDVHAFSGFGSRVTGYPGSYAAAEYIRIKFGEYGLEDVAFQDYEVTLPIDHGALLKILSRIDRNVTLYPLWPNVAAIVKTPPAGITGNLVYVGDGSSFDGVHVNGSIVLMEFNSWQNWLEAAKMGAKAVIFIEPYDTTWLQGRLKVIDIAFAFPRFYIKGVDAKPLLDLLSQGPVEVNLESDMRFETVKAPNVVGYVKGTQFPDLYIIVSAHFDSFSYVPSVAPGADSALGMSALLELAKFYAKSRYCEGGLENLVGRPRRPCMVHRISDEMVKTIVELRKEGGWCPHRIAGYMRKNGVDVSHMTVYRVLCREGLNHPLTKPRQKRSFKRWQRRRPNSLWQCDLKIVGAGWLITILDDHSRFVTGSGLFKEGTAENVIWLFDHAIHEHSKPREILTDHGSQFWSVRRGESSFEAYCKSSKIKHILGGIGKPTTLGKIERWFRTYDQEHAGFEFHWKFIEYYNYERPHMALNYKTPAEVYLRDVPNVL